MVGWLNSMGCQVTKILLVEAVFLAGPLDEKNCLATGPNL